MVREIARGWTPERAEELRLKDVAAAQEGKESQAPGGEPTKEAMRHFLYFPRKRDAEKAGERLRNKGFRVEVRKGADGENWLALAMKDAPGSGEEMEQLRDEMEAVARELGGDCDGWELAVDPGAPGINVPSQKVN